MIRHIFSLKKAFALQKLISDQHDEYYRCASKYLSASVIGCKL
ncbi:hypothetical protein [Photorhabdus thracensis]|nr:hypothetical protein [Photorhabdus thracensis]